MSNLSDLLPAGASGKTIEAVATANITSKAPVILNSAGTVTEVAVTSTGTLAAGTPDTYTTGSANFNAVAYDSSNQKIVIAMCNYSVTDKGLAYVGTVSGTSISYGTPVVYNSAFTSCPSIVYDPDTAQVCISWLDDSSGDDGFCVMGTVSGTSISFGSEDNFSGTSKAKMSNQASCYDTANDRVVIVWRDQNSASEPTANVGTVSGTSISTGTKVAANSDSSIQPVCCFDSGSNQVVMLYQDSATSKLKAVVGAVSGTSISFGTAVVVSDTTTGNESWAINYDVTADKVLVVFHGSSDNYGRGIVGTVSGTSISFGTEVIFDSGQNVRQPAVVYDPLFQSMLIAYADYTGTAEGKVIQATISGTVPTFSSEVVFVTGNLTAENSLQICFDSTNNKGVVVFKDQPGNYGRGVVITPGGTLSNLTATNFVGIADAAISSAATGTVVVQGGTVTGMSSLTTGGKYYVQNDGSISSPTVSGPYVIAGATYVQGFSVNAQEAIPTGLAFNTDGTKMFVSGQVGQDINEYALTTGFDVSTASFTQNFSVSAQETAPMGVAFNTDGTKMFVVGSNGDDVNEYTLSTGFDLGSTVTFIDSFSVAPQETNPIDIAFNTDGTKMFIVGGNGQDILEYALSAGFDVSTASYTQNFSVASQETGPTGMTFNTDGTKMFVVGNVADNVNSYDLSTGFDLSTASFASSFSVAANSTSPQAMSFNTTGNKMFIVGSAADSVNQYSTGVGSVTTVPAGLAISTTSLLLNGDS